MSGSLVSSFSLKALGCHDLTIVGISMASAVAKMILLSFSTKKWMIFLASGIGCISVVGYPAIESFLAQLAAPEEVGKIMAGVGIAANFAPLFSYVTYNSIYRLTLSSFPGATFLVVAGLVSISLLVNLGILWDVKRAQRRVEKATAKESNVPAKTEPHTNDASGSQTKADLSIAQPALSSLANS